MKYLSVGEIKDIAESSINANSTDVIRVRLQSFQRNLNEEFTDVIENFDNSFWISTQGDYLFLGPFMRSLSDPCPRCVYLALCHDQNDINQLTSAQALEKVSIPASHVYELDFRSYKDKVECVDLKTFDIIRLDSPIKHPACKHKSTIPLEEKTTIKPIATDKLMNMLLNPLTGVIRKTTTLSSLAPASLKSLFTRYQIIFSWFQNPAFPIFPELGTLDLAIGVGETTVEAETRALHETIERYSVLSPPQDNYSKVAKYKDIKDEAVDPESFWRYDRKQLKGLNFPLKNIRKESTLTWRKAGSKWIPEDYVYVNHWQLSLVSDNTTSGCAAHKSSEAAQLNALLELIERDNTMRHWAQGISMPHIDLSSLPDLFNADLTFIDEQGFTAHIIDCSIYPGIFTFAICLQNKTVRHPAILVASGCGLNPAEALAKAFREVIGSLSIAQIIEHEQGIKKLTPTEVRTPEDHGIFYRDPAYSFVLNHYIFPDGFITFNELHQVYSDHNNDMSNLIHDLKSHGIDVYFFDVGLTQFKELGVYVQRCISPQLLPITFGTGFLKLSRNLDALDASEVANQYPHPYS